MAGELREEVPIAGDKEVDCLKKVNVVPPSTKMMYELQIPDDRYVIVIKRLLLAEGAPIAYDVTYLPYNRGLPLVEREIKYATLKKAIPCWSLVRSFILLKTR